MSRIGSPSGGSRRTTRAPSRSSSRLANGPGRYQVKSTTSSPASGCTPPTTLWSQLDRPFNRPEDKRQLILDAAVRVFARSGYHACRVGDIAEEAGVAHGLLYHYFSSKDEVLETIFRDAWTELLEAFRGVEDSDETPREQLRHVAAILLRSWRRDRTSCACSSARSGAARSSDEGRRARTGVRRDRADRRARAARGRVPRRPRRRACSRGSSTARSRRSSPAGCSASCRTATRTSRAPSGRWSTSCATGWRSGEAEPRPDPRARRFGLAFSITTTAAYLPPLLAKFTDSGIDDRPRARRRRAVRAVRVARDRAVERHRSRRRWAGAGRSCSPRSGRWASACC